MFTVLKDYLKIIRELAFGRMRLYSGGYGMQTLLACEGKSERA
jgi:hypothetical protein